LNTLWISFLTSMAIRFPVIVAYLVGIIFSLSTWKRNSKPSVLSLIGFLSLLFTTILGSIVTNLPYILQLNYALSYNSISVILTISGVIIALIDAVAISLIIAAIFSSRNQKVVDSTLGM